MKTSYQDYGAVTVVTASGDFTIDDSDSLLRIVRDRIGAGIRDIVLDCEHLEYIDSAAIETLLRTKEQLAEKNGHLRLVRLDSTVRKILEMTRLEGAFQAFDTLEEAVRSVR